MAVPLGRAIAMTRTLAPVCAAASAILVRSPSTGTPWIRSRRLAGSASNRRRPHRRQRRPPPRKAGLRDRWRYGEQHVPSPSMAGTVNATPPATVSSRAGARCPVTSAGDTSTTSRIICGSADPDAHRPSSRLPR